jgi:hypothetical protein
MRIINFISQLYYVKTNSRSLMHFNKYIFFVTIFLCLSYNNLNTYIFAYFGK